MTMDMSTPASGYGHDRSYSSAMSGNHCHDNGATMTDYDYDHDHSTTMTLTKPLVATVTLSVATTLACDRYMIDSDLYKRVTMVWRCLR